MATWGAYFSSYRKKNSLNPAEEVFDKPSPFVIKPYNADLASGFSEDSFGLKRSDTKTKKLYTSPTESTTSVNELHQRSNSNAARVAKMFGYASAAPTLKDVVSSAVQASRAEAEPQGEQSIPPKSPILDEIKAVHMTRKEAAPQEKSPPALSKIETLQLEPHIIAAVEQSTPPHRLPTQGISPDELQSLPTKDKPVTRNSAAREKAKSVKVAKPSISSLDNIMSLLESETFAPTKAQDSSLTQKERARSSVRSTGGKRLKAPKPSISSLDDMMSMLEQDWNIGSSDRKDSTLDKSPPPAIADQDSSMLHGYTEEQENRPTVTKLGTYMEEPEEMGVGVEAKMSPYRKDSFTSSKSSYRKDSFSSAASSYRSNPFSSPTSSYRQDSFTSATSYTTSEPKSFVDIPENIEVETDEGDEPEEKPILDYIQEAEEMRLERERMEFERLKFLEEEAAFQLEADRFAEEEEQMRRFVENLAYEEELELENQERKRRIAEERRIVEEAERKRLQEIEDERLANEMVERLNAENERIEGDRKERERIYQERVDLERKKYVEDETRLRDQRMEDERRAREVEEMAERLRFEEEEEDRLEAQRIEDEEFEERQRLDEDRADRERYEEEEARRLIDERAAQEQWAARAKAARLRYEEEEAQRDSQRREDERIAQEKRRVERQRMERMRYAEEQAALEAQRMEEEEDSEPEVLTKEQELAKAEAKIRAAFAGLAEERDQLSKGVKPAGRGSGFEKGGLDARAERERGVSRYNTVGPRPRQENPVGIARGNTVGARPNKSIGGGLPSGPKAAGFGLPGGPRAGLPSGPRPRGRI